LFKYINGRCRPVPFLTKTGLGVNILPLSPPEFKS